MSHPVYPEDFPEILKMDADQIKKVLSDDAEYHKFLAKQPQIIELLTDLEKAEKEPFQAASKVMAEIDSFESLRQMVLKQRELVKSTAAELAALSTPKVEEKANIKDALETIKRKSLALQKEAQKKMESLDANLIQATKDFLFCAQIRNMC
ncbi:hypothetical protein ADUPG1_009426, partial [Aduncisulcus paluster]